MSFKQMTKPTITKPNDRCSEKRFQLRTLRHVPQSNKKNYLKQIPFDCDEDACFTSLRTSPSENEYRAEQKSSRLAQKSLHFDRENESFPYQKPIPMVKSTKKFRRKLYNLENDDELNDIDYKRRLTDTVFTNSGVNYLVSASNMNKRIAQLFDLLYYEIYKAKRKFFTIKILFSAIFYS